MARAIDVDYLMERLNKKKAGPANKRYTEGFNDCLMRVRSMVHSMPTLTPPNGWVSVEERLPELPEKDWCSKMVISCDKNGHVAPMIWERAQVRGKMIERWKYHWDRIYDGAGITHWMPLPAPPGEGNNVPNEAPNEPLTLEELRKMDGEPVYLIVDDQYEPLKMWALIEVVETANCVILTNNLGGRNEYYDNDEMKDDGVTAYRRPPEGEVDT